ncbi:ATP-binding protein [Streptomyces sp. NPDC053542]|uniref:ATP-binding protein n=1 Tax=Streptomyces sp. NPDC053542 TaxID=3365710 RepID=UPI0037D146B9
MTRRGRRAGKLPAEATELVGRRAELARVRRLVGEARLVTLTGVGGVGKTRLALRAAYEVQPQFPDGAWWVELSAVRQGPLLAHIIAEELPLADQTTRPMTDVLAEYLADRELLLILDTCEHLTDDCAMVVEALLRAAPKLRVLVTSRRLLGAAGEEVFTVEPLPVPAANGPGPTGADAVEAVDGAEAVALLAARAAEAVPGFAVTDANRPEVVALCRRLEGLPLAIELAAARLSEWPVADLVKRLEDRFAVLGETNEVVDGAEPPWHQALRTAIGWSHQLCRPAARLLWARLSVFAGSFDAEAARRVCADAHLPDAQIPDLLTALVDKSILIRQPAGDGRAPTPAGQRYGMLDTIREYGAGWLRGLGEERTLRRRHREYYRALAHRADAAWMGPDQIAWHDRMVAEHANLRAALDDCLAEGDGRSALELGGDLWFFWFACGFARDGRHYLGRALALDTTPTPVRARALWACGIAAIAQGDTETSLRLATAFRTATAGTTDGTALVAAAYLEGGSLTVSGHQARAAEVLDASPHTRPRSGRYDAAWFLARAARAFVHAHLRQFADTVAVADDLCAESGRRGETWARAWGDYMRALATLGLGRPGEAMTHARTALDGKHRLNDSLGIAMALDLLASATVASGHAEQAARLLGIAEQTWQTLGTPQMGMPELIAARDACEARARRLLGDTAYETAFHTGYDTAPTTAIAYALNTPAPTPPPAEID